MLKQRTQKDTGNSKNYSEIPPIEQLERKNEGWEYAIGGQKCVYCQKNYKIQIVWTEGEYEIINSWPRCTHEKDMAEYYKNVSQSVFTPESSGMTFDNFIKSIQLEAYKKAWDYATHFKKRADAGTGLLFSGSPGLGKSHLAYAIGNHVVKTHGIITIITTEPELFYNANKNSFDYDPYLNCPFLVIDDIGRKSPTDFSLEKLFMIVNHRMRNRQPTVYTTNFTAEKLIERHNGDAAIVERIVMTSEIIKMTGESYRIKIIKQRIDSKE